MNRTSDSTKIRLLCLLKRSLEACHRPDIYEKIRLCARKWPNDSNSVLDCIVEEAIDIVNTAEPAGVNVTVEAKHFQDIEPFDRQLLADAFSVLEPCMQGRGSSKCLGLLSLKCKDISIKVIALSGNSKKTTFKGKTWERVNLKLTDKAVVASCHSHRSFLLCPKEGLGWDAPSNLAAELMERMRQLRVPAFRHKHLDPKETLISYLEMYRETYLANATDEEVAQVAETVLCHTMAANVVDVIIKGKDGVPEDVAREGLSFLQGFGLLEDWQLSGLAQLAEDNAADFSGLVKDVSYKVSTAGDPERSRVFNLLAGYLDPLNQDPVSTGRIFAFFSRCAEDNAAAELLKIVADRTDEIKSKGVVHVTWYSTQQAVDRTSLLEHKPLCPVCATIFESRLTAILKKVLE